MLLAVAVFLVCALLLVANDRWRRRVRIRRRVVQFTDLLDLDLDEAEQAALPAASQREESEGPVAASMRQRFPLSGGTRTGLVAAVFGLAGAVALTLGMLFVYVPPIFAVVSGILLGVGLGWGVGSLLEQRVRQRYSERFLIVVEDFERMVRFGIGTGQALASVAASAQEPVRSSLGRVVLDTDFGVPAAVALGREAHRIRVSELAMLAAIVATQTRTGGGLSESVGNVAEMLRERLDNVSRTQAATAESKISLIILALVPLAAIGLQLVTQPEVVGILLGEGRHMLGIGAGLIGVGLVVAWLIVRSAQR